MENEPPNRAAVQNESFLYCRDVRLGGSILHAGGIVQPPGWAALPFQGRKGKLI